MLPTSCLLLLTLLPLSWQTTSLEKATIDTVVGTGQPGYSGDGGPAVKAQLNQPFDVIFDPAGNLYLSDTANHCVRKVDAASHVITTIAGNGQKGFSGDDGPATRAQLDEPYGLALDPEGNLYIVDRLNRRIRVVDSKSQTIRTFAGNGAETFSGDGGPATTAGIVEPNDACYDPRSRLLIADVAGHRLRAVDLKTGTIKTIAGTGSPSHDGDGGPPHLAALNGPRAVSVLSNGSILILERNGNTLRQITPDGSRIQTIAGTGQKGYSGDGGPATKATFNGPKEMALDPAGNIYIVDTENQAIRRIDAKSGIISTVAGNGTRGGKGNGGSATRAQLDRPHGVVVAPDGSLLIGDTNNHRVRQAR